MCPKGHSRPRRGDSADSRWTLGRDIITLKIAIATAVLPAVLLLSAIRLVPKPDLSLRSAPDFFLSRTILPATGQPHPTRETSLARHGKRARSGNCRQVLRNRIHGSTFRLCS